MEEDEGSKKVEELEFPQSADVTPVKVLSDIYTRLFIYARVIHSESTLTLSSKGALFDS